ncbi:MAG: transposase [Parcubacteria group bacterium]|nr:transposase [Parcubacteria group bacterium]
MRKEKFAPGEYYHIYNRGVDKRILFLNERDMFRFANTCYILNNFENIPFPFDVIQIEPKNSLIPIQPLVSFAAGCIMPNHYHFFVSEQKENGISSFFHKLGTSYTKYFNNRYDRSGSLFESTFKAKHINSDEYASYLTQYIHVNPIALLEAKLSTLNKIKNYPWSTLPDYLGSVSNLSLLLTAPNFRDEILGMDAEKYNEFIEDFYYGLCQA